MRVFLIKFKELYEDTSKNDLTKEENYDHAYCFYKTFEHTIIDIL